MKRLIPLVVASALAASGVAGATAATPKSGSLHIKHVVRGCHNWSVNGGPYRVHQLVQLARGGTLLVTNDDLMVQDLVKTSGPAVRMKLVQQSYMGDMHMTMPMEGTPSPYAMAHMGAQVRVWFPTAGTYHFRLIDRGDYFKNIKTVGPDNKPTLVVTVK
jgi:hypothetical protein